jgi:hypothetical protein
VTLSRLRATCIALAAFAAAACSSSSSTGTQTVTAGQLAQHYDQVASAYLTGGATPSAIGQAIEVFNGAMADGASPRTATIYNISASRGWIVNVVDLVDSSGQDSTQIVSLWYTGFVEATLQLIYQNAQLSAAFATDTGSVELQDSVASATVSLFAAADTCVFTQITNVSTTYPTYDPANSTCSFVAGSFSADTLFFPQADSSLTAAVFVAPKILSQTVSGVRLKFLTSAAFTAAVANAVADTKRRR